MNNKFNYRTIWTIIIAIVTLIALAIGTPIAVKNKQASMKESEKTEIQLQEEIDTDTVIEENEILQEEIPETESTIPPTTVETEPPAPTYPTRDGYKPVDEDVWAKQVVNVRAGPGTDYDKVGKLATDEKVKRIGIGVDKWSMIWYEGKPAFVSSNFFKTDPPEKK